jgi:hypothetical protein
VGGQVAGGRVPWILTNKMSNVRDSDTSLWLHNKLGSNESWAGGSISSQLNPEVLKNIKDCFVDLQTQVKLKLLLSFFHIPRRNIDEVRDEFWFKDMEAMDGRNSNYTQFT